MRTRNKFPPLAEPEDGPVLPPLPPPPGQRPSAADRTLPLFPHLARSPREDVRRTTLGVDLPSVGVLTRSQPTPPSPDPDPTPERRGYVLARQVIRDPESTTAAKKVARMLITLLEKTAPSSPVEGEAAE